MKKAALIVALSLMALTPGNPVQAAGPVFVEKYEDAVSDKKSNVLLVFGTDWCKYCKYLKKDMDSMNLDDYVVCFVNAQERKDLRSKYKIGSYPTSIIVRDEEEVSRKVGYENKEYMDWLDTNRSPAGK